MSNKIYQAWKEAGKHDQQWEENQSIEIDSEICRVSLVTRMLNGYYDYIPSHRYSVQHRRYSQ